MSEDEKKETPTPEEGADNTVENEGSDDNEDVKSLLAQKKHFREKAEKLEKEKQELLSQVETKEKEAPKSQPKTEGPDVDSINERIAKIEFSQSHPEIEAGDIEEIFKLAGMNGQDPNETLEKNEMVKVYLEKKAAERKVNDATPTESRSGVPRPEKPTSEMSREEHMEWAKKVMGA